MCTSDLNLMSVCRMRRYRCLREGTRHPLPLTSAHPPPPPGPPPGQVTPRPALQKDDLSAEGAKAPLDEEGASIALESERSQVMGTGSLALQRLVQLLLQEELGGGTMP